MPVISLFPLEIVAFPAERVALHVFEPRYLTMVASCEREDAPFGILPVLDEKRAVLGTAVRIAEVAKRYDDGRLDVLCIGQQPFRVVEFRESPDVNRAHQAEVKFIATNYNGNVLLKEQFLNLYLRFHQLIHTYYVPEVDSQAPMSYQLGHTCGLSISQQISLLEIEEEDARLQFLIDHVLKILPMLEGVERTRNKIRQNGHYKALPGVELRWE